MKREEQRPRKPTAAFTRKIALQCSVAVALAATNRAECRPAGPQITPSLSAGVLQQTSPDLAADSPAASKVFRTYRDKATGVAFRYPSVWKPSSPNNQNGYLPPAISDSSFVEMRKIVFFSPDGNLYEKTNLQQLSFAYGVARVGSAAACSSLIADNQERTGPVRTASRGGQIFTEVQGGDAAMSHRLQFTLDSTWHSGKCLVFEQDEATIAPYVQEGKRVLSVREEAALQRHLHAVLKSISFAL